MSSTDGAEWSADHDLDQLIARYRPDALRVARRLVRSDAEAEDLTQTAILNVLRRARYIEDVSNVKAYLLTSVRNLWRNQLRQQGSRRFVGADAAEHIPSTDAGPEERVLTELDTVLAREAFRSLSRVSREVLELRYVDGLGFLELSEQLGSLLSQRARERTAPVRS